MKSISHNTESHQTQSNTNFSAASLTSTQAHNINILTADSLWGVHQETHWLTAELITQLTDWLGPM